MECKPYGHASSEVSIIYYSELFFRHRAHGATVGTAAVVPVPIARIEVQAMAVIAIVRRSGPAVTAGANIAHRTARISTVTRCREHNWISGDSYVPCSSSV